MKNKINILITGGAGYLGSIMTELFLSQGYKVKCIDRFYFGQKPINNFKNLPNYEYLQKDIRDLTKNDMENIDCVIDLAGISNDPSCDLDENLTDQINHHGTVNVAKCAKAAGVPKYIMASSCSIYGASDGSYLKEGSAKNPVSIYAKSKIDSENDIINLSSNFFSVTFLRLATVYGLSYRMRFDLIINIMTMYAFTRGKIIILGGGNQWRPLVHVKDVARAFKLVIESESNKVNGEVFNVGSNEQNYRVNEIATKIKNTIPEKVEVELVPDDPDKRSYKVDFSKIFSILNYKIKYDISYGINEIYDALKSDKISPDNPMAYTVKYYEYLINAEKIVNNLTINGKLF
jgi:nucleoside-diphosphate-sugar epimerase